MHKFLWLFVYTKSLVRISTWCRMEGFMKTTSKTSADEKSAAVRKHDCNPCFITCVSECRCLNGTFPNISITFWGDTQPGISRWFLSTSQILRNYEHFHSKNVLLKTTLALYYNKISAFSNMTLQILTSNTHRSVFCWYPRVYLLHFVVSCDKNDCKVFKCCYIQAL